MAINLSKVDFSYSPSKKKNKIKYTLKDINLNIEGNDEFIAILGHTGSGKSTLVQLFNALNIPTSGREVIFDTIINNKVKLKEVRKRVGLVFQFPEYQIFEDTVLKDVMFGPKNFGLDEEKAKEKSLEVLTELGIYDLKDRSPFSLSGGQMRKVAIAGILSSDPDILVLDEPTVGLDPKGKEELIKLLVKLNEEKHKSIILITHDMNVVSKTAKRCVVLKEGKIVFDGSKKEMFENEDLLNSASLSLPTVMKVLKEMNERYHLDLDIYKTNTYDAFLEIKKRFIDYE